MKNKKLNGVSIGEVAKRLTVGKWFTKAEFSAQTGIALKNCGARIHVLKGDSYLDSKPRPPRNLSYRMSQGQYDRMIAREIFNEKNLGKKYTQKNAKKKSVLDKALVGIAQYAFLQSVRFV